MAGKSLVTLGKILYKVIVQVSWDRELWVDRVILKILSWNGKQLSEDWGDCMFIVDVFWQIDHWVGTVLLERWSWNRRSLNIDAWHRFSTVAFEVSKDAELFELVELSLGDSLQMADTFVVILGQRLHAYLWILLEHRALQICRPIFKRWYLNGRPHSSTLWGETLHFWLIYISLCVQLEKVPILH